MNRFAKLLPARFRESDGGLPNAVLIVLGLVALIAMTFVRLRSPNSHVLVPEKGARWIRMDEPTLLSSRHLEQTAAVFRKRIAAQEPVTGASLSFRAMKHATVFLDRVKLHDDSAAGSAWNYIRSIPIPVLEPGRSHELLVVVQSPDSHPALLAYSDGLGIRSGIDWEVSTGNRVWVRAMLADQPHPPAIAAGFPSTFRAFTGSLPFLLPLFLLAAGLAWLAHRGRVAVLPASRVRWIVLAALALMAVNNVGKLPIYLGMDYPGHLEYIRYVADGKGIPYAGQGWQMFQAPLYYLLSAPLFQLFQGVAWDFPERALRVIPLICGITQVELCYRAMRAVHPGKEGLQIIGLLLSAMIPMNLYISQTIGNEPLSAVFSSMALVLVLIRIREGAALMAPRFGLQLGLVLGLALLTKTSNFLVAIVLPAYCLAWGTSAPTIAWRIRARAGVRFLAAYGGILFLVAGWYYLRNWVHLGAPFVGGWDPKHGVPWWQDHSYIPVAFLFNFGSALVHPVYAQTQGFLNGLYSTFWTDGSICSVIHAEYIPPWNFRMLLSGVLLSVAPCALMIAGALRSFHERATRLSVTCVLVFLAAIFWLHLGTIPAYSTLKSTYMLGLLPCFGILGAAGFEALPDRPAARAIAVGLLVVWVATTFCGFWVL